MIQYYLSAIGDDIFLYVEGVIGQFNFQNCFHVKGVDTPSATTFRETHGNHAKVLIEESEALLYLTLIGVESALVNNKEIIS
jgi:hypothetical protein